MKLLNSKYDGRCIAGSQCVIHPSGDIHKGDTIYWTKPSGRKSITVHQRCAYAMVQGKIVNRLPVNHGIVPQATQASGNGPTPVPLPGQGGKPAPTGPKPSCLTCPNVVEPGDTAAVFGAPFDSYVCAARGVIINAPGQEVDVIASNAEQIADTCSAYGQPVNGEPKHYESRVAVSITGGSTGVTAMTCTDCKNYITPDRVAGEFGWGVGMCAGVGKLIFPKAMTREPLNCGMSDAGKPAASVTQVELLVRYDGAALAGSTGVPAPAPGAPVSKPAPDRVALRNKHMVDPRKYETDAEVTDAHREKGYIKAWRKVEDPEGYGKPILLPIFDGVRLMAAECPNKLPEDTTLCTNSICDHDPRSTFGNHRPDLYVDHSDMLYRMAAVTTRHDYVPLLEGPSGSGKTEMLGWMAYLMDLPFIRIPINKGTEVYHLAGEKELVVDESTGQTITSYRMGRFSAWYGRSCWIVVDEANLRADVWEFLRPAADGAKRIVLDDAQGIVIERGPRTFFGLTQNPAWDPLYVGTEPVSAADLQRVAPFWMDYPAEDVERDIIIRHCKDGGYDIPAKTLDHIMQISADFRRLAEQDSIPVPWGVRSNVKVAKFSESFPLRDCYRHAILDGQERSVVEMMMQSISTVVG